MDFSKLETRELGKYFEYLLVSKLIKLKFDVFVPVIDKGIDFIITKSDNGLLKYFELQVKSVRKRGGRLTIRRETFRPDRKNLFLVFFNVKQEGYDAYLIPSEDVDGIFEKQEQRNKPIYRFYVSEGYLKKIKDYEWNLDFVPKVWEN